MLVLSICSLWNGQLLHFAATFTELPTAVFQWNHMDSDSNCVVNLVRIIHDCVPRLVDLDLTLISITWDR